MKVVNKKLWVITITLLVVIECVFTYLSVKSYSNKDITELKEENKVNKEMFAMYIENDDGNYEEYKDGESFTIAGYKLNISKSNCVDNKGNAVSDIITNSNNKVTVSSNKTVFCYLYFDKDKSVYAKVVSDYQNNNGASKISSTSAETGNPYDVYYYTGDITNNNIMYGGFCWKMVITTETNGVKLIYNGVPTIADDGMKSCDNSGIASQIGTSKFNSNNNSLAYAGYMYNKAYTYNSMQYGEATYVLPNSYMSTSASYTYYYGDKAVWNPETNKYDLKTSEDTDVTSTSQWSSSTYESLVGKYTCRSTSTTYGTSCAEVYYVVGGTSSRMYYYEISNGKTKDNYNIKLSNEEPTNNGDGTYTLVEPIEVAKKDWYTNYSSYKNYYYCSDLVSETCSDMYYSTTTTNYHLIGLNIGNNYKYGNSFNYDESTGTYILIDTDISNIKQFWNWDTNYNTLNQNHYTCFNTVGECIDVKYIYYASQSNAYYITLTNGIKIEEVIDEMLYAGSVNKFDSTIKDYIDTWYEENLLETKDANGMLYSNYLDNAIFCANREMSPNYAGGWNPNGGRVSMYTSFNSKLLECTNKTDRFTLKESMGGTEGYGNNALDYPIALLSYKEADLGRNGNKLNYLKSGQTYWLLSPSAFLDVRGQNCTITSNGSNDFLYLNNSYGVRPVVSLSSSVEITSGNGSVTNPYQVKLSE